MTYPTLFWGHLGGSVDDLALASTHPREDGDSPFAREEMRAELQEVQEFAPGPSRAAGQTQMRVRRPPARTQAG
ncbi:hypothetical protein VULLAG_LOCUS23653 [Vulpes lagopus]